MVYVLCSRAERFEPRGISFRALTNFVERRERLLYFRGGENADGLQSFGPGAIDRNFVRQKPPVERKRALERVEPLVRFALEASAPQPVVFAFGHLVLVGQAFLPVPVLSPSTISRPTRMSVLLISFGLGFGTHSYRQRKKIDETLGVL